MNFLAVVPMAGIVYWIGSTMDSSPLMELAVASVAGGAVYLLTCRLLCAELLKECLILAGIGTRSPTRSH
jgi:hypothetical protein